jgi:calpain-7
VYLISSSDDTEPEKLWQRISKAFGFGDVLVTLGTGKLSRDVEREIGLIGEHNYTLLALDDTQDQKRFLIKNPWVRGVERASVEALRPEPFWLSLQDVIQNFESMYLSWNPGLFRYRQDIHFSWDMQNMRNFRSPYGSFVRNPQYTFTASASGPVWVLLSKHLTTREETSYTPRRAEFLSLYLFASEGRRVIWSKGAIVKAPYVDSPQALLKLDAQAGVKYTVVFSEQDLLEVKHNFSLSVFSGSSLNLELAPDSYERSISTESGWTPDSAGGRSDLSSYSRNPQFALELTSGSALCLMLETAAANLRTHVVLVHSKDQRIFAISTRDVLFDSGSYRSPCAIAVTKEAIPAGHYTIICSTYEANELGRFTLTIMSDAHATVKAVPREGGGRLRLPLRPGAFRGDVATVAAPLIIYRMCRISLTACHQPRSAGTSAPSPFSISVERGRGPDKRIEASVKTGLDGDVDHVLRTREMDLRPEMSRMETVWIVLERNDGYEGVATSDELVGVDIWIDVMNAVAVGDWQDR